MSFFFARHHLTRSLSGRRFFRSVSPVRMSSISDLTDQIVQAKFDGSDIIHSTAGVFNEWLSLNIDTHETLYRFLWSYYMYNVSFAAGVTSLTTQVQSDSRDIFESVLVANGDTPLQRSVFTNLVTTNVAQQVFMAAIEEFHDAAAEGRSHRDLGFDFILSLRNVLRSAPEIDFDSIELSLEEEESLLQSIADPVRQRVMKGYGARAYREDKDKDVDLDLDLRTKDIYRAIGFHCASEYFGSIEMTRIVRHLLGPPFKWMHKQDKFDTYWLRIHASHFEFEQEEEEEEKEKNSQCDTGAVEELHFNYAANSVAYLSYYLREEQKPVLMSCVDEGIVDFCDLLRFFMHQTQTVLISKKIPKNK